PASRAGRNRAARAPCGRVGSWSLQSMPAMKARLYLVPGFFGFTNLGELQYFGHVRNFLAAAVAPVEVEVVRTPPTSSLPVRAARLVEAIAATSRGGDAVHLIGHSSGGLDIRLALSPGVSLPTVVDVEGVAARVRT